MIEIAVKNIEKYYGANPILKGLTFEVNQGLRIGLLGKNGAGKTTLFKLLAGLEKPDTGEIMLRKGSVIGLLDQIPHFPDHYTAHQALASAFDAVFQIQLQMAELESQMTARAFSSRLLEKYGRLQQELEALNGYAVEENVHKVCTGLKITGDLLAKPFPVLSGGEKTRIVLGRLILQDPDILLLDEPTNHLDLSSIEWLEEYLKNYRGTVVLISHDRYFLDRVVSGIIELVEGRAEVYEGNYSSYFREKEARRTRQLEKYEQEQKKIKQLETAAKRMHEWANNADNPQMHRRAFNIEKRIERMDKTDRPVNEKNMNSFFGENSFSGKEVIAAKELVKVFEDTTVLDRADFMVYKSERVAILGKNGTGKSTLFKILTGEYTADEGSVKLGNSVTYAYLPQVVTFESPSLTLLDTVRTVLHMDEERARSLLAGYKFRSEDVFKVVANLSGGEKSRLRLCLMMQENVNLLLLDEPTNHLDIASREWLEAALEEFGGTLVFISHDRYFINKFATRISELENDKFVHYDGDYEYFKSKKAEFEKQDAERRRQPRAAAVKQAPNMSPKSIALQERAKKLEAEITSLEAEKKALEQQMELCSDSYNQLSTLYQQHEELESKIHELYNEWASLDCPL